MIKQVKPSYTYIWNLPVRISLSNGICDSARTNENEKLKSANKKLKKLVKFLKEEIRSLELKTAANEKAVPLEKIIKEFTSTPGGKAAWQTAWDERADEWKILAAAGKISRIKYYRLINGMNQATLDRKLKTAKPNIARIEKPGYNVPIKTLEQLAKIFRINQVDLIED